MTVGKATFNILGNIEEESPSVRSYAESVTDSDAVFLTAMEEIEVKKVGKFPKLNKPTRGILDKNVNKI